MKQNLNIIKKYLNLLFKTLSEQYNVYIYITSRKLTFTSVVLFSVSRSRPNAMCMYIFQYEALICAQNSKWSTMHATFI